MKVGIDVEDDARRAGIIRSEIGWEYPLMMDANQVHTHTHTHTSYVIFSHLIFQPSLVYSVSTKF